MADFGKSEKFFALMHGAVSGCSLKETANREIIEQLCLTLGFDAGFVYIHQTSQDKELRLQVCVEVRGAFHAPGEIDCLALAGTMEDFCQDDLFPAPLNARLAELFAQADGTRPGMVLAVPFFEDDRIAGIAGVWATEPPAALSADERSFCGFMLVLATKDMQVHYNKQRKRDFMESLERAIDNTGVDIYVTDYHTDDILYINKSMAAPYGKPEELLGKKCYLTLYKDKKEACSFCPKQKLIDENGNPTKVYSWDYQRPFDGVWFRVFSAAFRWEEGRLAHVITSTDITESKRNESLVEHMAFYDTLTMVPNRRAFNRDFNDLIRRSQERSQTGFILFLDLDNFKHINDAFGHEKGDQLLKAVGAYLQMLSNELQQVYRYGGDEFIILMEDIAQEAVEEFAMLLLYRFTESWDLDGLEYFCTVSIGVASFPADGVTYDVLLNAADQAMYEAKKLGKSTVAFSRGGLAKPSDTMEMEFALRRAVLDGCNGFEVLYHPVVDIRSGCWVGLEALIRWNSPQYGEVLPDVFIPMCEKLGLIYDLERWVVTTALEDVVSWPVRVSKNFFVSFNVSAIEFINDAFTEFLLSLMDFGTTVRLMLEVAESSPHFNLKIAEIRPRLNRLREKGVLVALDGFGIGHNSLERIQKLQIDFIKIDRKFVTDCMDDEIKVAVVKSIIMLARAAHAEVCAEGAESPEHLKMLESIGCNYVQGRYFLKPSKGRALFDAMAAADFCD